MRKNKLKIIIFLTMIFVVGALSTASAEGVKIAVIDSGATGYVDEAVSFTSYAGNEDPLHHGTVVSKLIREQAPYSKIYMLQVCESGAGHLQPSTEAVKRAIVWAMENRMNIVNMSLVIQYNVDVDDLITKASEDYGIIFVGAEGSKTLMNHFAFDDSGFVTKNKIDALAFPSANKNVISVGGLDESGQLAYYSGRNSDIYEYGKVFGQEGSSFACARVSGKLAHIINRQGSYSKEKLLAYLK